MAQSLDITFFLEKAHTLPIIDVRSPGEFDHGHIPGAVNIPLFSNEERAKVGTRYKQVGKDSAVLLGLEIVGPKLADFVRLSRKVAPDGEVLVHCWRGGMRSGSFAWLLETAGMKVTTLQKGYKSYRQEVLQTFEQPLPWLIMGGKTGSGKTEMLQELAQLGEQVLDLEGLAHHKGSAFGALGQAPQPTTEQFENQLHLAWTGLDRNRRVWIEDESISIGSVSLPHGLWRQMRSALVAVVDVPQEVRIQRLVREYGAFSHDLLASAIVRIKKRLGGLHYQLAMEALKQENYAQIAALTLDYYDKAYLFGLSQRLPEKVFEVPVLTDNPIQSAQQLVAWAESLGIHQGMNSTRQS
ncbi:MAG: tRNA 2-selenouridine(34) synthase MnmH [Bacteroidota bacterium]